MIVSQTVDYLGGRCKLVGGCSIDCISIYVAIWEVVAVLIVSQTIGYLGGSCSCFGFVSINQLTIWEVVAILVLSQSIK